MHITCRPESRKRVREENEQQASNRYNRTPLAREQTATRLHNLLSNLLGVVLPFLTTKEMNDLGRANQWLNKNIFGKFYIKVIRLSFGYAHQEYVRTQPPLFLLALKKRIEFYQTNKQAVSGKSLKKILTAHMHLRVPPLLGCIHHLTLVGMRTQVDEAELQELLCPLPNLRTLRLCWRATNDALKALCQCPSLEHLSLAGLSGITNEGLAYLQSIPLKYLNLTGCSWMTNSGLRFIHEGLQTLNLTRCYLITHTGLLALRAKSSLRSLKLIECLGMTDEALECISQFSALQSLSLQMCYNISDEGLSVLQNVRIKSLDLRWCPITDKGLENLQRCTSLRSLKLSGCNQITDNGLQHLAKLSLLENIELKGCEKVTKQAVELLGLPVLRTMRL